jgi:hypothetical protein
MIWLILVNYVENHRKSEKCETNFVGFVVKYPTTLLLWPELSSVSFCMKNTNVKNLDLQFLKIYKSSAANFWICCVLGHN